MAKKLRITLLRSPVACRPKQRRTLRALGLNRIGQTVVQNDAPELRGMIRVVDFMVKVEENAEGGAADAPA
ncbi:MAG TPA: 50S ribosomal protein L30 [Bacillota bacterium]|jgi:large subunit ribosomal protein L30|nr:50S ribosomal protein L30 [Bacillota bacterium]HOA36132.1 50S ribosomal protein L30 [Bacillota bacterium]HOJ84310.1 50S ribosomal protein L30 [Bacillota bacterium]HOL15936.1 50S ribosomal protein L30 [Bacillota bacterium]HPZ12155.1 50S ribosomal protein L30 [Bacillota bacterium]